MQKDNNTYSTSSKNDKINLKEVVKKYSYHWKLFLLSMMIALTLAFIYLQVATYKYQVSSTILINDEDNDGGSTTESSVFQDLGLFGGPKTSIDTEIGILRSKSLIEKVAKELKLNITYYTKSGISSDEIYGDQIPFNVNLFTDDSKLKRLDTIFSISAKSTTKYNLFDSRGNQISEGSFGERVSCNFGDLVATPVSMDNVKLGQKIIIKISPLEDIAIHLKEQIKIVPDNLKSNLLILTLQNAVKLKAKDILDNLVLFYNRDAIEYKSQIAQNTDEFVSNRIDDISKELSSLDQGVQSYKTRNQLSNLDSESSLVLASNAQLANRITELNSQIKLIDYLTDYMKTNTDKLIPSNLGLLNESTSQNTMAYNNLLLERNRLSVGASEENPVIVNLNDQIESLRESIDQSLLNTRSSLQISLDEAKQQEAKLTSKISASPRKEREIRDIQRQQEIIETLYLYLLQKREENSISLAVTTPNAKIIDKAYGSNVPVAPRRTIILLGSMLLGLLAPALLLGFKSLFDDKVHTAEDLEGAIKLPILGNIPTSKSEIGNIVFEENSIMTESFRLVRANINHILQKVKNKKSHKVKSTLGSVSFEPSFDEVKAENDNLETHKDSSEKAKTIFITSTLRNEGKTFIAMNLAKSFALLNKKVLLVEADLRNPKISDYLNTGKQKGMIDFLISNKEQLTNVITPHKETNIDVVTAGNMSASPSELLANGRFEQAIQYFKKEYDYIIVDTTPVNVASDTLLIGHLADMFIYVIRANYLDKKILDIPKKLNKNRRLPNMAILMNDTNYKKRGYSSAYSYGQEGLKKPWWRKQVKI